MGQGPTQHSASASPAPAVWQRPPTLLLAHAETPRRDIDDWATQLRRALEARRAWPPSSAQHLARAIGSTNAIALLEAHRGDLASAERICHAQLRTVAARHAPSLLEFARHAVNPWINLGRLASLRGDADQALRHFAVFRPGAGSRLRMGGVTIGRRALNEQLQNELAFPDFAARVYVVDTLRALVRARDAGRLACFVADAGTRRAARAAGHAVEDILAEAGILARLLAGDRDGALRESAARAGPRPRIPQVVFTLRLAEASAGTGEDGRVPIPALLEALPAMHALLARDLPLLAATAAAVHAAQLSLAARHPRVARQLATSAADAAARQGDLVLRHAALASLAAMGGRDARVARAACAEIETTARYRVITGRCSERSPALARAVAAAEDALGAALPETPVVAPARRAPPGARAAAGATARPD